jgi:ParB-like chromosome segregation protein Spo0J
MPPRHNVTTVTRLSIDDLLASAVVDPGAHLDAERVAQYADTPAGAPPVVVYDTPEGRLLVDGYHRIAAARQRGAGTIDAEIRHGSRTDALRYAAATAAVQRGVSFDEAVGHIKRRSGDLWGARQVDRSGSVN